MTRRVRREDPQEPERRTNWTLILLLGGLVLLVLIVAYLATARDTNPDRLTNSEVSTAAAPDNGKLCAGKGTYESIKAELFRQAAQLRGSDQQAYDQLSGTAVVRMENPVMESENSTTGAVNCSGSLSLDLPPAIAVADGRRTLMSDIDYSVQPGVDGASPTVVLGNAGAIVDPLSKLVRVAEVPRHVEVPARLGDRGVDGVVEQVVADDEVRAGRERGRREPDREREHDRQPAAERHEPASKR